VRNGAREVERLRLIKSEAEVRVMKRAADISCQGHSDVRENSFAYLPLVEDELTTGYIQVMRLCGTSFREGGQRSRNLTENSLVSQFEHTTSSLGSPRPAYVPVCASGQNALTIHYIANNQPVKEGDLVMLDAGCEYGGYASDITRASFSSSLSLSYSPSPIT